MATRRRNGLALKRNGALNHLIAKKIKVNIRTAGGREAVKQYKRTPAYKKWAASKTTKTALAKGRTAAKARTAKSKAYTKKHGASRAAEYMASRGGTTTKKRKSSTKKGQVRKTARRAYETKSGGKLTSWQKHVQKTVKAGGSFADASATYKKSTRKTRKTSTKKGQVRKTARRAYESKSGGKLNKWQKHVQKTRKAGGTFADASASYKKNSGRRRNPSRRRNSSYGALALRTNPMRTGVGPIDMVAGAVDKVPVVGPRVAPYIAPLAVGAAAAFGVGYLHQYVEEQNWLPEWSQPYSYSLMGVGGAVATLAIPVGSLNARRMIAAGMATLGAGADVLRHFFWDKESASVADYVEAATNGDLGALAYKANRGYGALAYKGGALNNPGYGAYAYEGGALNNPTFRGPAMHANPGYGDASEATGTYMDASQHDAQYSPGDFDMQEAQVLMMGPRAFFQKFGKPAHKMAHRQKGGASRHAGQPGHKWGWMVKLIGFKGMQQLASMPAPQRRQFIAQLKSQAQQSLMAHSGNILPDQAHVFEESGATGAHGYGAIVYKGGAL